MLRFVEINDDLKKEHEKTNEDRSLNMSNRVENLRNDSRSGKRKKRRRIILIILGIIFAVLIYFALDIFFRVNDLFNRIHHEVDSIDWRAQHGLPELTLDETPFSVLILGIDRDGPADHGRSDTIMVATVNPNEGTTYLLSIARDTRTLMVGLDFDDKINHAFAFGGTEMAINSVQHFLNIPIDYYAELDMSGFGPLIDAVGGVRVYNDTVAFTQDGHTFPLGYVDLDSHAAMAYISMRFQDPHGDFGRQQRQRAIIGAMASEMAGIRVVTRYQAIIDATGDHLRTDIHLREMIRMSTRYTRALRNVIPLELRGEGQIINGIYYHIIAEDQRLEMSQRLRRHLELE